jgi:hypothetical protein
MCAPSLEHISILQTEHVFSPIYLTKVALELLFILILDT